MPETLIITGIYQNSPKLGFSHLNGSLISALKIGRYSCTGGLAKRHSRISNESHKEELIDLKGDVVIPCIWGFVIYKNDGTFARGFNYSDKTKNLMSHTI